MQNKLFRISERVDYCGEMNLEKLEIMQRMSPECDFTLITSGAINYVWQLILTFGVKL